jgi:hypothetical protein
LSTFPSSIFAKKPELDLKNSSQPIGIKEFKKRIGVRTSCVTGLCKEVAKIHKTIQGKIFGIRKNDGVKFEFSKSIKEGEKQIFRNVWSD